MFADKHISDQLGPLSLLSRRHRPPPFPFYLSIIPTIMNPDPDLHLFPNSDYDPHPYPYCHTDPDPHSHPHLNCHPDPDGS